MWSYPRPSGEGGHAMSIEPQESNDAMDIIGPYDIISHVHIVVIKYTYYRMKNGTSYTTLFAMYDYSTSPRYGEQRFQGVDTSRPWARSAEGQRSTPYQYPHTGPEGSNKDVLICKLSTCQYKIIKCT